MFLSGTGETGTFGTRGGSTMVARASGHGLPVGPTAAGASGGWPGAGVVSATSGRGPAVACAPTVFGPVFGAIVGSSALN
ncbi:hypothetical protein MAHJHV50_49270 [Mycobacterium avium subsp. hominissuis]